MNEQYKGMENKEGEKTNLKSRLEEFFKTDYFQNPEDTKESEIFKGVKLHKQVFPVRIEWEKTKVGLLPKTITIDFDFQRDVAKEGIKDKEINLLAIPEISSLREREIMFKHQESGKQEPESAREITIEEGLQTILGQQLAKDVLKNSVADTFIARNLMVLRVNLEGLDLEGVRNRKTELRNE